MIFAADLFCGAGGSSTGLVQAAEARHLGLNLLAVNHWKVAVATHSRNHPWARHICADLSTVDPSKAIPGGRLNLLIASPECTHHSNARGGKPCSDQSRASAWHVCHWAERLQVDDILIENVREFQNWGPLLKSGRPDPRRKGATFKAFINALESMGYRVEWRVINAADYGDATTRRRLFIRASRGAITWPEPTHAGRWRAARTVIDWSLKGESIFNRKRPLAPRTLDRIEAGLKKFGGEPFIAVLRGTRPDQAGSWAKSVEAPLGTISAGGIHAAICEPFIMQVTHHGSDNSRVRSVEQPLVTITTGHRGELALCEPFLVRFQGGDPSKSIRVHSVDKPLPTQTTENRFGLCQPFVIGQQSGAVARSVDEPLPTIATAGAIALCQPFLTKYYRTAKARSVEIPLDTVTTKARFALVQPEGMDIRFRMLQPHELAQAMGFDGYEFSGTKTDQVRQIGNAVAVNTAAALCGSILDSM